MAAYEGAPYHAQDRHDVAEMLRGLEANKGKGKGKGGFSCKKATFSVDKSEITVDSWRMQDWDYKKPNLPTYARGIFTTRDRMNNPEIAVRGYDKFFNHGEVSDTEWQNIEKYTRGPYELSVKENGCIIFLAGLEDGSLIVCSKHSTGSVQNAEMSHARAGEAWVERHLSRIGKTKQDLAAQLRLMNATAVAELCDDDFEEHVLAYTPETAGLYLHGINLNLPEFATYPHHLVDRFAEEWGFKKTTYTVKDDIRDVKAFLDEVAETGSYEGRDTEGFVIRCQSKAHTGEWHDWFFKYKFEEPYLMYRQWRECTKAIISGKEPRFKKHKKITEAYLLFARKQLHGNPALAKAYNANHGIIKMRDDFLASQGLKGSDIILREAQMGEVPNEAVSGDVVLVPVATIGCGKTTLALALCRLFDWGHIQNDNITVKKNKPFTFATTCAKQLEAKRAVIADRNNHQRRERQQITHDMSQIVPNAHFVALQYVHDRSNYDMIRQTTRDRVLTRGDNHQTIQAASKGSQQIIGIMEGFMERFEPIDQEAPPDDRFDLVIDLDVLVSSRENLETVVNKLYVEYPKLFGDQDMPTADDMDAAIEGAMHEYTVDIKHEIKSRSDDRPHKTQANGTASPKERKIEYFSAQLPTPRVPAILSALMADAPADVARTYNALKHQRRIQSEFHVTLMHRASMQQDPGYWAQLADLYAAASKPNPQRDFIDPNPQLGRCKVRLEHLVWDHRVMAFTVRLAGHDDSDYPFVSVNRIPHITVGTMSPDIKPKEAGDMLVRWSREGSGANGINEMPVKGNVELDAVIRAVLQR